MNLNSPIREIKGIGVKTEQLFQQLGAYTVGDITPSILPVIMKNIQPCVK